ncbi:MAG: hypothetical protein JXA90_15755 [Planctomycetes bacterium]|nr:hypothetical protein [Planctomycetota bacterium]
MKSTCSVSSECLFEPAFQDPCLSRYSISERRAILDHRFFLSIRLKREASFEETVSSWESGVCVPWRRKKMVRDRTAQLKEIERHKYFLSMQCGRDIGWEPAALDWIQNHAAAWRDWWEQHWFERQWWEDGSLAGSH